jgi:ribosomal protein S18 acetylase RimI-like enzyme
VSPLEPFPAPRAHGLRVEDGLRAHGLWLRGAVDADVPALRLLYDSTRAEELAGVPWPEPAKAAFLAQQFAFQHRHYVAQHADAKFLVVIAQDQLAGRFYVASGGADTSLPDHVIDVSLMPAWRNRGVGTMLLRAALAHAASRRRGVVLQVSRHNPGARRLYERLGFVRSADSDPYIEMRWSPGTAATR